MAVRTEVRFGSKNGSRGLAAGCLLCPGERTSSGCLGMSEKCHVWTSILPEAWPEVLLLIGIAATCRQRVQSDFIGEVLVE